MIIKVYEDTIHQDIHIIDNVEDVVVHQYIRGIDTTGDIEGDLTVKYIESSIHSSSNCDSREVSSHPSKFNLKTGSIRGEHCRHIDYTRNGVRTRLIVRNYAYICNDQGKTIEKVSVGA